MAGPRDHGERAESAAVEPVCAQRAGDETSCPSSALSSTVGDVFGTVRLQRFVLPPRDEFSSHEEFERYSGPLNWNRQQGIYIYRADRLVQWGGWNGIRGIDEHTKLARASLEFDTDLDSVFNINVAKMRVTLPPQIRQMLERPINELCAYADDRYRKASRHAPQGADGTPAPSDHGQPSRHADSAVRRPAATRGWRCVRPPCRPASTRRSVASSQCSRSGHRRSPASLGLDADSLQALAAPSEERRMWLAR